MSVFSEILVSCRKALGLTQVELLSELANYDDTFENLNNVTLSRWENGTTETSLNRKRLLLKYFSQRLLLESAPCNNMVKKRLELLYHPLAKFFEHNYASLIHNLPQLRVALEAYNIISLHEHQELHRFENIVNLEEASHAEGYYRTSAQSLQLLCQHPSTFAITVEHNEQHLGHFIMHKIKEDIVQRLIHYKMTEAEITVEDFASPSEKGSYYVHALYGVNPTIASIVNTKAYLYLYEHLKQIDNVVIFSTRKDGLRLAKAYGIEVIDTGVDESYNIIWSGMRSPVEDILFSDTVLKLVF